MKFSHAQVAELSKEQGTATKQQPVENEIRGSLHCAVDGETVRCFGRDDESQKNSTARTVTLLQAASSRVW